MVEQKLIKPFKDVKTNQIQWALGVTNAHWKELPIVEEQSLPDNISKDDLQFWERYSVCFGGKTYGPLDKELSDITHKTTGINIYE